MTIFSGQVSQSTDDAGENGNTNNVTTNGTTLGATNTSSEYWGFRFQNVTIPQGATITAASVSVWSNTGTTVNRSIDFNLAINPATFVNNSNGGISGLTLTGNSVTWNSSSLTSGAFNQSPDLTAAVQAIVNQASWASGNAMICVMNRLGAQTLVAEAYDGSPSEAATLSITYTAGSGPGAPSIPSVSWSASNPTELSLTWTQGSGTVTDNEVVYGWGAGFCDSANSNIGNATTVDIGSAATSYTLTGLTANTMYFIAVRAGDSGTWGDYSPIAIGFTGPSCTLRTTTDDTTTGWTLSAGSTFSGELSTGIAGLDNGTYTLSTLPGYAAAPTGGGTGSPLIMTLGSLPGNFGIPQIVGLNIVLLTDVGASNDAINVYLYESNGSSALLSGTMNIPQGYSDTFQWVEANDGFTSNTNWNNAKINLQMPSASGDVTKVFGVEIVIGYTPAGGPLERRFQGVPFASCHGPTYLGGSSPGV